MTPTSPDPADSPLSLSVRLGIVLATVVVGTLIGLELRTALGSGASARPEPISAAEPAPDPPDQPGIGELDIRSLRSSEFSSPAIATKQSLGEAGGVVTAVVNYTSEGRKLQALETRPAGDQPLLGYPVVIWCHGYTNPLQYETTGPEYRTDMETLSRHGYVVIKPDYRGQGGSPGAPEGGYFSDGYTIDVLSLIAAIKQTPHLNAHAIGIAGHSMGGYIALKTAVISPDIKAVVLLGGAVGTPDELYQWQPLSIRDSPTASFIKDQMIRLHGTPAENPQFWTQTSPLTFLKDLKGPVQIHVGGQDGMVPPSFSTGLEQRLQDAHIASSYYEYPEGGHGLLPQRGLIWPRMLELLDVQLQEPAATALPNHRPPSVPQQP